MEKQTQLRRRALIGAGSTALLASFAGNSSVLADTWPSKLITIVVPYAPGGSTDVISRLLANELTNTLNVSVIVDNKPGAEGQIGANYAARRPPDGYTLAVLPSVLALVTPLLKPDVPYANALVPVVLLQTNAQVLFTRPNFPASTLKEVVELARAQPGKISYGHTGIGTGNHFLAAMLQQTESIEFTIVPYKGELPTISDVMGGHLDLAVSSIAAAGALIAENKIKPIAALGIKRPRSLPNLQTVSEAGYDGFNGDSFLGLHAPAGVPAPIIAKLAQVFDAALRVPSVKDRILELGGEPAGGTQADYQRFLDDGKQRVERLIKQANIKLSE